MKIEHNKVVFYMMLAVLIALLIVIGYIIKESDNQNKEEECIIDSDCVKASCCHAKECVPLDKAPDCEGVFCSQECVPDTLDCGQGACKCIDNKCEAVME